MHLDFFFGGKLSREESASAFLATLLDCREDFQKYFLTCLPEEVAKCIGGSKPSVEVEYENIDIRLDFEDTNWVVLIENKILPGAKRKGQLVSYYRHQIKNAPSKRFLMVYLAPGEGMGKAEVQEVESVAREQDQAKRVSWDALMKYVDTIPEEDEFKPLVSSGFDKIENIIEHAKEVVFPIEGDRKLIDDIINEARERLVQRFPAVMFGKWIYEKAHQVATQKGSITIYAHLFSRHNPSIHTALRSASSMGRS